MRRIVRTPGGWGLWSDGDVVTSLRHPLVEMLHGAPIEPTGDPLEGPLLAPVDVQEVWGAGVTYQRSLSARTDESTTPDIYQVVYLAERPELFFKASASRVLGPDAVATVRADSTWDVPEPELALVLDARGGIFGYTIADDLSSRSIEGESPLYLPQAKVWDGSCVLGPWIVPVDDVVAPFDICLRIERDGREIFNGETSTSKMARSFQELTEWLLRCMTFPDGVVLMTGTGVVPDDSITLLDGDRVQIDVDQIGCLKHAVATCGR